MDYRNYIKRRFGLQDGSQLLKESVYPDDDLERDMLQLEMDREETEQKVDELHDEQEAIYEEGVGAPEYKKQSLATEAELIETERRQYEDTYQVQTDKLGLLRAVRGARRRMKSSDLTVDQLISDANSAEVKSAVSDELRDLKMDSKKINKILGALNISAKVSTSTEKRTTTNKHFNRMEEREEEREYEASAQASVRSSDSRTSN
jgi:hypothetical protein